MKDHQFTLIVLAGLGNMPEMITPFGKLLECADWFNLLHQFLSWKFEITLPPSEARRWLSKGRELSPEPNYTDTLISDVVSRNVRKSVSAV